MPAITNKPVETWPPIIPELMPSEGSPSELVVTMIPSLVSDFEVEPMVSPLRVTVIALPAGKVKLEVMMTKVLNVGADTTPDAPPLSETEMFVNDEKKPNG